MGDAQGINVSYAQPPVRSRVLPDCERLHDRAIYSAKKDSAKQTEEWPDLEDILLIKYKYTPELLGVNYRWNCLSKVEYMFSAYGRPNSRMTDTLVLVVVMA